MRNKEKILLLLITLLVDGGPLSASRTYAGQGLVLKIDQASASVRMSCQKIPGLMPAGVMSLPVRNRRQLDPLRVGDMVDFTLVNNGPGSYVQSIRLEKYESVELDPLAARRLNMIAGIADPSQSKKLRAGDAVPDFTLIDQLHRRITLSEFRGKVVALNFVYTHCLLPNYCFRMSNNFRRLQKRFADAGGELVLLTISFDPQHDTPEVLADYGKTFGADPKVWHLLTGDPPKVQQVCDRFGMSFWPDEGLMTHSLHTVIIDRNGNLVTNLEGNQFTADQLGDLVETVLKWPQHPK